MRELALQSLLCQQPPGEGGGEPAPWGGTSSRTMAAQRGKLRVLTWQLLLQHHCWDRSWGWDPKAMSRGSGQGWHGAHGWLRSWGSAVRGHLVHGEGRTSKALLSYPCCRHFFSPLDLRCSPPGAPLRAAPHQDQTLPALNVGTAHPEFHSVGGAAGNRVLSPSPPPGHSPIPKSCCNCSAALCAHPSPALCLQLGGSS